MLFGDAAGAAGVADELGALYVPEVESSEQGTPLFGAIAAFAERHGRYDTQMYINCDILTTKSLIETIRRVPFEQFLLVGQRVNLTPGVTVDVTDREWERQLPDLARNGLMRYAPQYACDYFVFRRGLWSDLPPTIIGRAAYDNALIAHCLRKRIPVIDATEDVSVLHPAHDYGHVAGGKQTVWEGEEARVNRASIGNCPAPGTWDATWQCRMARCARPGGMVIGCGRSRSVRAWFGERPRLGLAFGLLGRWARRLGISRARPLKAGAALRRVS